MQTQTATAKRNNDQPADCNYLGAGLFVWNHRSTNRFRCTMIYVAGSRYHNGGIQARIECGNVGKELCVKSDIADACGVVSVSFATEFGDIVATFDGETLVVESPDELKAG